MYNKLDRKKNPPNIITKDEGGMLDLFDNGVKESFIITDDEYDLLAEKLDDKAMGLFIKENLSYKEAKTLLLAIKDILG